MMENKTVLVVCTSIAQLMEKIKPVEELQEEIKQLKIRHADMSTDFTEFKKEVLAMVKRGFITEDDPFYEREHLEKPVRSIVQDILEELER